MAVDVWPGNPPDMPTVAAQITQAARRFGCQRVTFVGERGMIKSPQMEALVRAGFHDITALLSAADYRQEMRKRFASWAEITWMERAA